MRGDCCQSKWQQRRRFGFIKTPVHGGGGGGVIVAQIVSLAVCRINLH